MKRKIMHLVPAVLLLAVLLVPAAVVQAAKTVPSIKLNVLNATPDSKGVVSGQNFYLVEVDIQGTDQDTFQVIWCPADTVKPEEKDWEEQGLEWYEVFPGGKRGFVTLPPQEGEPSDAVFVRIQTGKNKNGAVYSEPQKLVFRYKTNLKKTVKDVSWTDELEAAIQNKPYTISWKPVNESGVYYQLRVRYGERFFRWVTKDTSVKVPGEVLSETGEYTVWINVYKNGKLPSANPEVKTFRVKKKGENFALQVKRKIPAANEKNFVNRNMAGIAVYKKTSKLTRNMKFSGKVYVPSKALAAAGDSVIIEPVLIFSQAEDHNHVLGNVMPTKTLILKALEKGKIQLKQRNPDTGKESAVGSLATVKKTGSYYMVTFKNIPLAKKYIDVEAEGEDPKKINTSRKYSVGVMLNLHSTAKKKWSAAVCVDDVKLAAGITQTITFDKMDYKDIGGFAWDGTPVSAEVKPVKTK